MEIIWLGQSCFKIKGENLTLVTDPFDPSIGLKLPKKLEADIVTISHDHFDHNNIKAIAGNPFVVDGPGEYEVSGVNIRGFPTFHDSAEGKERGRNTVYLIELDGLRLCHLGDLGHILSNELIEQLDGIDILMIPCGGHYTIGAEEAQEVISQTSPKIIIPMHYKIPGLNIDLDDLNQFCKEMGICEKPQDKLKIKKSSLATVEKEQVVVLQKK